MHRLVRSLSVLGLALWSSAAVAADRADPRAERALKKADLAYEIDGDNDFSLLWETTDNRTHVVFVLSRTYRLGGLEVRKVMALAGRVQDDATELHQRLLQENANRKLGAWEIQTGPDGDMSYRFMATIPVDVKPKDLRAITSIVADTADALEAELSESDDL